MAGDDDELLTIGEVAKLDGITAKALRYYDAHNILKPAAVDPATGYRLPATGYRYYTPDQMLDVDVMRICIAAGVPLDSLEKFRFEDGSLDWRALLAAAQSQVDERIQQLRRLQTSITDYSGELVRKAFSPEDGLVRADLLPTWLVAQPCLYGNVLRYKTIFTHNDVVAYLDSRCAGTAFAAQRHTVGFGGMQGVRFSTVRANAAHA